ncbi:MAG: PIN domain-containing protein [Verrucomicrobia bacterium]|nr:PIN domain-containing protein [Verrucomicrobiota bacterium]
MIAVDTNILIYAHRAGCRENSSAQAALEKAMAHSRGWGIPLPCISEFWAQVTHPRYPGGPSTSSQARDFIDTLTSDGHGKILLPKLRVADQLLELANELDIHGPRIFDLQIGLTALQQGAKRLWTHDRNFTLIPGLKIEDPL